MDTPQQQKNGTPLFFGGIVSVSALIKAEDAGTARRRILRVLIEESRFSSERRRVAFLRAASERLGFRVERITAGEAEAISDGPTHGGIFAEVTPAVYPGARAVVPGKGGFYAVLDGAEDPYSLGHIMRALYLFGASGLITGRMPDGADATVCRASAGMSELLPVFLCDTEEAVRRLKSGGFRIAAAEIRDSEDASSADLSLPLALICGGEKRGISSKLLSLCDLNVRIPYFRDYIGSLPSETAVSVLAYEIMKQNSPCPGANSH